MFTVAQTLVYNPDCPRPYILPTRGIKIQAKRQRAEYIMQRSRIQNSVPINWIKRQQADYLSRKLARHVVPQLLSSDM